MDHLLDQTVSVITNDGRNIVGCLKGVCGPPACRPARIAPPANRPLPPPCALALCPLCGAGFDQALNIILEDCHERVYSSDAGVEQVVLGLYIIRGDNLAIVGEMDAAKDQGQDLSELSAEPLKPVVH